MERHRQFQRHRIPRPGTEEEESVGEHLVIEGSKRHSRSNARSAPGRTRPRGDILSPPSVETASTMAAADRSLFRASNPGSSACAIAFTNQEFYGCAVCWSRTRRLRRAIHAGRQSTKWHLAHTTWFFETLILKKIHPGYRAEIFQSTLTFSILL